MTQRIRVSYYASQFIVLLSFVLAGAPALAKPNAKMKDIRLKHAKELLGKHYKRSVVRNGEKFSTIRKFIFSEVKESLNPKFKDKSYSLASAIIQESERYKFDPIFLMSIIDHESTFNPSIRGSHGEIGLMQIKPDTAEWICKKYDIKFKGAKSLFDPATNVKIGAAYLDYLRGRFESHGRLYLAAYNMGVTNVHRALDKQIWPKDYPSKVMQHYIKFYTALRDSLTPEQKAKIMVIAKSDLTDELQQAQ